MTDVAGVTPGQVAGRNRQSLGDLDEPGDIGSLDIVDMASIDMTVGDALLVNVTHDLLKSLIDLFARP